MKTGTGKISILIIGIIVVAVSIVVFATRSISVIPVYQVAFGFLLLAEVVFFVGLIFSPSKEIGDKIISVAGITAMSIIYLIATIILSLFAGFFMGNLKNFVVIEIVIVAICAVIGIVIVMFSRRAATSDKKLNDGENHNSDTPKRGGY